MYNLLSSYAIDNFLPIAKWLAIAMIALSVVVCLIMYFAKKDSFSKVVKYLLFCLFIFLAVLGLACLIMEILKGYSSSYAEENWLDRQALISKVLIPITALLFVFLVSAVTVFIVSVKSSQQNKQKNVSLTLKICGAICLVGLIVCGILLAVYYNNKIANDGYYNSDTNSVNQLALYISAALLIITIIALAFILDRGKKERETKWISMGGICIAMSFGLSYIGWGMPQGGSITLFSLLPIMIFSCVYGTKKGVLICFIYGVLQAIQDPWIIHPAQFLLDYPIAFSAIGLSGALSNSKALNKAPQVSFLIGGIIASVLRYASHVLSGVFAFSVYAEGANPWVYSLAYNSFVFADIAITLVVGVLLLSSKAFLREIKKGTN